MLLKGVGGKDRMSVGVGGGEGEAIQQVIRELGNPPGPEQRQYLSELTALGLSVNIHAGGYLVTVEISSDCRKKLNLPSGLQGWLMLESHYCA